MQRLRCRPGVAVLAALVLATSACGAGSPDAGAFEVTDVAPTDPGAESTDRVDAEAVAVTGETLLPLRVQGRHVVDATGARVRLVGVNWDGGHQEGFVPSGLDLQTPRAIAARLRELGLNSVRLTYSDRMVRDEPVPPPEKLAANPELQGQSALLAFDAVVEALAAEGLLVILNNHTSDAQWCCGDDDGNMLWYNERFSEADWIADWVKLARRYRHLAAAVGADLRNEPRAPSLWGTGVSADRDWPSAAERCGEALLAENPDLLILVEGVGYATDLSGAADRPIALPADRLVYSAHNYGWSMPSKAPSYQGFALLMDTTWGYLMDGPTPAPVWLGEFGLFHREIGNPWWLWLGRYLAEREVDWSLWGIFAYGDGTWGLLDPVTLEPKDRAFWESLKLRLGGTPDAMGPNPGPALPFEGDPAVVTWVSLPGGAFQMGAPDLGPASAPVHAVTVPPFLASRTEVTVAQYQACAAAGACPAPKHPESGDGGPAQWLTWEQAKAFCTFAGARLCSEAEWELAASGAGSGRYPWGDAQPTCDHAVWTGPGCAPWAPLSACSRPAGAAPWGLCDLAGNVLEWVEDDWHDTHVGAPGDGSPWIDAERGPRRVLKGGSFAHPFADGLRAAWRERGVAWDDAAMFGARCCRTP